MAGAFISVILFTLTAVTTNAFQFGCAPLENDIFLRQMPDDVRTFTLTTPWYPHMYEGGIKCLWTADETAQPYTVKCVFNMTKVGVYYEKGSIGLTKFTLATPECNDKSKNRLLIYSQEDEAPINYMYCGVGYDQRDHVFKIEIFTDPEKGHGGAVSCVIQPMNDPGAVAEE